MNHNNLHNIIDGLSNEKSRAVIILYLEEQLPALSSDLEVAIATAYDIAGLMATEYARNLKSDDPIDEILTIAGELEIGPDDAEKLRHELIDKIKALL